MASLDVRIIMEAARRGIPISASSAPEFRRMVVSQMTAAELAQAAIGVAGATARRLGGRTVPLEVAASRRAACEANTCGNFARLADGEPACLKCGCCGSMLSSIKFEDPMSRCPMPSPLWVEWVNNQTCQAPSTPPAGPSPAL